MRRCIRAILAIVTLALTIGVVPGFAPGSDPEANAGVVGADNTDTMGFRADQIPAAVYYPAQTQGQEAHTIAIDVDDDGNVYSATNWAMGKGKTGDLGAGAATDVHSGYFFKGDKPRTIVHKVSPSGVQEWSWELNGRGYNNYPHFDDVQNDPAVDPHDGDHGWGEVTDIVVDDDGNTYVTGWWWGEGVTQEDRQQIQITDSDISVHVKTGTDGWVASIDPDGNTRWVKVLHSWGYNYGSDRKRSVVGWSKLLSVDVDNSGSVVVGGRFTQHIYPVMDNTRDHPDVNQLYHWKNKWATFATAGVGNPKRLPNEALWNDSHHPETIFSNPSSPYVAKLNASDGTHQWHYVWNTCQKGQASSVNDVKFLSDGDIVTVGGYNDEAWYATPEDCKAGDHSLDGETTQGMNNQRSGFVKMEEGARSNIVKLSGDGDFMWGREFGSKSNINTATDLAIDPNNDDMYIVGVWEVWDKFKPGQFSAKGDAYGKCGKTLCEPSVVGRSEFYMAPSTPANHADYPEILDLTTSWNPRANMGASDHEPKGAEVSGIGCPKGKVCKEGWQVNQDTYLLHTDKHGNYKNHETYDVHLVKDHKPGIDVNRDGTELVIANTGIPQCSVQHTSHRREGAGWIMAIDLETSNTPGFSERSTNLNPKWITISEPDADAIVGKGAACGGVAMKDASNRWRDVQFGPNGNVYAGGGWYNQVKFGETSSGEDVISHTTWPIGRADAVVVRYDTEGNVAGLAVPPPPNVAPDGYGIVTGPAIEDGEFFIGPSAEVVWNEPLCKGGRWEVTPQPELAVRQYMILKASLAIGFGGGTVEPADVIRTLHSPLGGTTHPNYNILWEDGFLLDEDGSTSTWPETFKLHGWDAGVGDLDDAFDRPVAFYFRNGVFTYNTNSSATVFPASYGPSTEVSGHSWDLDLYETYLAFAHSRGDSPGQSLSYPEFEQKGCEPGEFVFCSGTSFDCADTYGFTVSKDTVTTTEEGDSESFTVCLVGPVYMGFDGPTADVVMDVVNTDSTEVELSTDTLVFTPDNWDDCQPITVTGLDDSIPDGDITSYVNIDIDHDVSSYEYADVPNDFVTVVNENGTELVDLLPPPENDDLDGDGILNGDEVDGCVLLADCDGDGINDGNEIFACMLSADCDGDGVGDNEEISQACIQDPSCTGETVNPVDDPPVVDDPLPIVPPNPDPDPPPGIITPDPPDDPQPPVDLSPDLPIGDPDQEPLDTDGDGVPDDDEEPGCDNSPDCDNDGILDDEDSDPTNPDSDNDGLVDGLDPDPDNPDSDGDGIPDGQDSDADGDGEVDCPECDRNNDGIADGNDPDNPGVAPGGGDPDEPAPPSDTDNISSDGDDDQAPLPVQTPDTESSGRGLADRLGDLPLAAVAAAAALAIAAAAAAAASLAGPSLLSWLFRGSLGVWLFGLLFGRRGVRCSSCDLKLVKQEKLWVDKDTQWVVGINNHTHVPADFSDKDRDKYVTAVQQILQRSDP